jgi:hypothetical protein
MHDSCRETGFMPATTRGLEMDLDACSIGDALIDNDAFHLDGISDKCFSAS